MSRWETRPTMWDDEDEPNVDVCTNCGAYFDWNGVMRTKFVSQPGNEWARSSQRCFKCLTES